MGKKNNAFKAKTLPGIFFEQSKKYIESPLFWSKKDGYWDKYWNALFYKFLLDNKKKLKGGAAFYLRNLNFVEKKSKKEQNDFFSILK